MKNQCITSVPGLSSFVFEMSANIYIYIKSCAFWLIITCIHVCMNMFTFQIFISAVENTPKMGDVVFSRILQIDLAPVLLAFAAWSCFTC